MQTSQADVERNRAVAIEFFDRWLGGNWSAAEELVTQDFTFTVPSTPDRFPHAGTYTSAGFAALLERIGVAMPHGVQADITATVADGDRVVVLADVRGLSRRGEHYDNKLCYVLGFHAGAIAACREYLDTIHANEVLVAR